MPFRNSLCLLLIAPLVASCASNQLGPSRPITIDNDVALMWPLAYPDLTDFYNSPLAVQASERNQIITARMYIADLEYHTFEARLTREMQDEGLLATAVNLGLTTSATLVPLAHTKTLLSGIATGVTGLDKAYDEKELLSNTIQALQTQMRADRKTQAAVIRAQMFKDAGNNTKTITPIAEYPLPMALSDTDTYYQAGTVASSLIGLSKTVANAETNADQAKSASGPNPVAVANAKATAAPLTNLPSVIIPSSRARFVAPLDSAGVRLPPLPLKSDENPEAINSYEKRLKPETVKEFQGALCAKTDRHLASLRQAMVAFFQGLGQPRDDIKSKGITALDEAELEKRQVIQTNKNCKGKFSGPAEVGRSFE
jgi:hypothetical protein